MIEDEDISQDDESIAEELTTTNSTPRKTGIKGYRLTFPPRVEIGSVVQRIDDNKVETDFEDMLVVLDLERSKYHNLNVTGNVIWQKIEQPIMVSDLITDLRKEYTCTRAKCKSDVLIYLHQLLARRLLKILN